MQYVLYALLAYVLYNFIFKLVIPVYLASRRFKKGIRDMQNQVQEKMKQQQNFSAEPQPSQKQSRPKAGDYIDFEEVRFN